jgi:hypothetical protein
LLGWEKRAARRVPIDCPAQLMLPDGSEHTVMVHDLSVNGCSFECGLDLPPDLEVELRLTPPPGSLVEPLQCTVRVVRTLPGELPFSYTVAASTLRVTK